MRRLIAVSLAVVVLSFITSFLTGSNVALALDCKNPATNAEAIKCGSNDAGGQTSDSQPANVNNTIQQVINILSAAVGIVAVVMIIVGGYRYITSAGSADKTSSAKNTLLYAVIGLVIVALAQVIARFTLHTVTK